ncbi:MAG: YibE/F family protein [Vallitaleaceae bacterium]|nr:YibE/F family protein [Vallitaleaceae bacterium]
MKKKIVLILFLLLLFTNTIVAQDSEYPTLYKGKVVEVVSETEADIETSGGSYNRTIQLVRVELLDQDKKGQIVEIENYIDEIMAYTVSIDKGDAVYVFFEYDDEGNELRAHINDFRRDSTIYWLLGFFAILMVLIGGTKGVKSLVTLFITVIAIYYMLQGILDGGNPFFLSIVISLIVTLVTMFVVAGFNVKAVSAIIGTFAGVIIAGILSLVISRSANLTGLGNTEAQMLLFSDYPVKFDIAGILFASILIGTLGSVMDVCMSISSSINEITEANPLMSTMELFKSGMNIGKDVMGTMVNTLILAYVGSSVFLILIFMVNRMPYINIVNMDIVATEVVRAIAGTIGLICAIPATAIISAHLEKKSVGY